jgi:hypothetical protein
VRQTPPGPDTRSAPDARPDRTHARPVRPSITVHVGDLGLAHTTVTRDAATGLTAVAIGSTNHRIVLADDPNVLMALLTDGIAQIQAIAAD